MCSRFARKYLDYRFPMAMTIIIILQSTVPLRSSLWPGLQTLQTGARTNLKNALCVSGTNCHYPTMMGTKHLLVNLEKIRFGIEGRLGSMVNENFLNH